MSGVSVWNAVGDGEGVGAAVVGDMVGVIVEAAAAGFALVLRWLAVEQPDSASAIAIADATA